MNTVQQIAKTILRAAEIRENSYDHEGADIEMANENYPNFSQFYRKTLTEASEEAAQESGLPEIGRLVDLTLYTCWNDIIDWANEMLGEKPFQVKEENQP